MTAALFLMAMVAGLGVIALKVVDLVRQWRFDQLPAWQSKAEPWLVEDDGLPLWARRVRCVRAPPYDWSTEDDHAQK